MRPQNHDSVIHIPITFDGGGSANIQSNKLGWSILVTIIWLFGVIVVMVASDTIFKFFYPFISGFFCSYIFRFLIMRERYYKAKRAELIEADFSFSHTVFWNIYEITNRHPHMAMFGNGMRGVFIALDKNVVVGKGDDAEYYHHEAIAEAYKEMGKRGIECIHIDYVDTLGNDTRMKGLFEQAEAIKNKDLKSIITHIYDHIDFLMRSTYASYDVYAFYSNKKEDVFWDDLQPIIRQLRNANYLRARVLSKEEIASLVKTLMNIKDFSVNNTNEKLFMEMHTSTQYIRPIWTELDGVRTKVNKTLNEIEEEKRVQKVEKRVKRNNMKDKLIKRKKGQDPEEDEEIDLFN